MVGGIRPWLAWALHAPWRGKAAQLRAIRRIKRTGAVDPEAYLAQNPDVASAGIDPVLHYVTIGAAEARSPGSSSVGSYTSPEVAMKRDWDARARADAKHFVVSARLDWDEVSYSKHGREAVEIMVVADLERLCSGSDPASIRMLEIGCGNGRMTEHLAAVFGEVHAVDVSGEMIARARGRIGARDNVHLYETGGSDLAPFDDSFFDLAFSVIVFQHVPSKEVVLSYFREVHRTLKPGGVFKFQVQGHPLVGQDVPPDTWVGVSFNPRELRATAEELGFRPVASEGEGTQYFWNWWVRGVRD